MDGHTRRRLLMGVSAGSLVLTAAGRSLARGDGGSGARRDDSRSRRLAQDGSGPIEVSIVETDAPVGAGEYLQVTAELENVSGADVRTEVALVVGERRTRIGRRRLTVSAGETETVRQGFFTYPVPTDDAFPVRVETDHGVVERTVSVRGASTLPTSNPDPDVAVRPGTEVFFEAGAVEPEATQRTHWWLDGEYVTGAVGGPWTAAYYGEADAHYWQHAFDSSGTYEVAAAVVPDDGDRTYATRWTVEVTDGGVAGPTIESRSPAADAVDVVPGERYEVELTATDPEGRLDRVVWWLTQADVIVDVTDIEGETATATLSTDAFCHTCSLVPWVLCTDGRLASFEGWRLRERGESGALAVSIRSTNAPVPAGERLEVTADVANDGRTSVSESIDLVVGDDPETVDTRRVSLAAGESETVTVGYETYPVERDDRFPVRVVGADETDQVTVLVRARRC